MQSGPILIAGIIGGRAAKFYATDESPLYTPCVLGV